MTKKILITDKVHNDLILGLEELGYEVEYDESMNNTKLRQVVGSLYGVIINSKMLMDREMIEQGKQLRFIGRLGSGMEIIDQEFARQRHIEVFNTPQGNCNAVAEHALGMLLALANNLIRADKQVKQFQWDREGNRGFELKGKTIGIIGFGHTGSAFAGKLSSWELDVLAYDKYKKRYTENFRFVKEANLREIQEKADIISFHLPLTAETHHLVDANFIAKCKDGVIMVNTSRGKVIKTLDLLSALEVGKIGGACLDVFENEKPNSYALSERSMYSTLFSYENVVVSPHIAGWTKESLQLIARICLDKIKAIN